MGHPADLEKLRFSLLDMAHVEGFQRSPADVTASRLMKNGLSPTIKQAFEARYPEIEIQSLLSAVDRVLLSSEPYAFRPRDVSEVEAMDGGKNRPAVSLIDAEMTSWYGSRAIAGMQYLARLRGESVAQA